MRTFAVLTIMPMLVGCGTSRRAGEVEPHRFLGDYSMLTAGAEGQAVLRYVNDNADWAKLVEQVVVLRPSGAGDIPEQDLQTAPISCTRSCASSSARTSSWSMPRLPTGCGSPQR